MTDPTAASVLDHVVGALSASTMHTEPWPHCYVEDALPRACATAIEATFDRVELASVEGVDRQKTYRMHTRRVDLTADVELPSPVWRDLVDALSSAEYRAAVTELTGVSLDGTDLTVDLWEYRDGDWLAPHVDKPAKVVTQLFYFSKDWEPEIGGHLLVLDAADAQEHPAERLRPVTGTSAVLVRSDSSWHAVEATRGPGASRCSIAATFWRRPEERSSAGPTDEGTM